MKSLITLFSVVFLFAFMPFLKAQNQDNKKLNIIIIGAHPDDPDKAGGTAYKWAQTGP